MKKRAPYFVLLLFGSLSAALSGCDTERNTEDPDVSYFMKYYGGDGNQYGVDMQILPDGTFLLLGNYAENSFDNDLYLMRVDMEGNIIWELRFGEDEENTVWTAKDLEPTNDGNFVVLADFQTGTSATRDISVLKFSPDGVLLNSTMINHSVANEFGRTVTVLNDGRMIVSGTTEFTSTFSIVGHPDPDLGNFLNYRLNADLEIDPNWGPVTAGFVGAHLDVAVKAVPAPDGYYVYGFTNSGIGGKNQEGRFGLFYFHRDLTGTTGAPFYPGNLEASSDTEINFVEEVASPLGTGVVLVGTSTDDLNVSDIYLARMRSTLSYSAQDVSFSTIVRSNPNVRAAAVASAVVGGVGYLVLGNEVRGTEATNVWLSKIDQSGDVLWSTTLGSESENEIGARVVELPDGKIAVLGSVELADNQYKMALFKVNRRGQFLK